MKLNKLNRLGFTLIELLIVIAILGILTVLGVSNFQTARIKARDVKRKSDLATISKSVEAYVNDHARYPVSQNGEILCQTGVTCPWGSSFTDGQSIYAATLPMEENSTREYRYESTSGVDFTVYAALENANDPAIQSFPGVMCGATECNYKVTSSNIQ